MLNTIEIKRSAKQILSTCYLKCVAVSLVLTLSMYGFTARSGNAAEGNVSASSASDAAIAAGADISSVISELPNEMLPLIAGFAGLFILISIAVRIFLLKPLEIGCRKFFINVHDSVPPIGIIASPYSYSYFNQVKILFFRDLFLCLWTMLFVIPGIIKSYSYRMIPYILAEDPFADMASVFNASIEMMNGHKMEVFIYDLSFIGWYILGAFTCGIAGVFYVYPYKAIADAGLYLSLKNGF